MAAVTNLPRASLPRASALGKDLICRRPVFAEGRTLGKGLFAEGRSLPRASVAGPRQRVSFAEGQKPQALGKARVSSSVVHMYMYLKPELIQVRFEPFFLQGSA